MMKHVFKLALCVFLFSACGKNDAVGSKVVQTQSGVTVLAQDSYAQLPGPDMDVTISGSYGAWIQERSSGSIFCQKTGATIPNPTFTYSCWRNSNVSSLSAQSTFDSISAYNHYTISVGTGIGAASLEEATNADSSVLCRKSTPLNPTAVSSYSCFLKI